MNKINVRRVLLGGLGAGLIINAVELVAGTLMRTDMSAAVMRFGLSLEDSGATAWLVVIGFGYGIFAVWLYAAIRPRFGPGPWTAVCTGIAVWFVGDVLVEAGHWALGLATTEIVVHGAVVGLVEMVVASVAGGAMYREER